MAKPGHIRSLDTLRGLAALSVAAFHGRDLFGTNPILPHAYMAVDLFFVLSGFILMHRYGAEISGGQLSAGAFAKLRFARLYPLYLAATAVGAAMFAVKILLKANVGGDLMSVAQGSLYNALVLPDPFSGQMRGDAALFPFLPAAWSVLWEFVLSGCLYAWLRSGGRGLFLIIGLSAASLAVMTLARQTVDGGWAWSGAMMGFVRALSGFAGGVLVSRLVRWLALPAQGGAKQAAIVAAAASGVIAAGYVAFCPEALGGAELAIVLIGFPTLVCGLALTRSPWMENRLGDVLGGASYSIYLLHTIVIEIVELALKRAHIAGSPLQGLAWMSAIIGLSYVCWRRFETPARIWAQRLPLPTFSARAASPAGRA